MINWIRQFLGLQSDAEMNAAAMRKQQAKHPTQESPVPGVTMDEFIESFGVDTENLRHKIDRKPFSIMAIGVRGDDD